MSELVNRAFQLAAELHAKQTRKGTTTPYLSHLMAVSALVLEDGGSDVAVAAALLHDAAEDQGGEPTLERIRRTCGDDVAKIVAECSDSIGETDADKAPWKERKDAAIAHLPESSLEAALIKAADKLHNASAILADLEDGAVGLKVWDRFNASREDVLWYYRSMAEGLEARVPTSRSVRLLRDAVERLFTTNNSPIAD